MAAPERRREFEPKLQKQYAVTTADYCTLVVDGARNSNGGRGRGEDLGRVMVAGNDFGHRDLPSTLRFIPAVSVAVQYLNFVAIASYCQQFERI